MKKVLTVLTIIALLLTSFVSCNGDVDERMFGTGDCNHEIYSILSDGSWQCTRNACGHILEKTDAAYITVLDAEGQPKKIIPLTAEAEVGTGRITVSGNIVTYTNDRDAQNIVIRTTSAQTQLVVNAPKDTIYHYDKAGQLDIISVASTSFHEFGEVPFVEIAKGRIVLEENSEIEQIHISTKITAVADDGTKTKEANTFDDVIVNVSDIEDLPVFSRDQISSEALASAGDNGILVVTVETATDKEKTYLFKQGIYEQIKVAKVENAGTGDKVWIDTSSADDDVKTVAKDIANNVDRDISTGKVSVKHVTVSSAQYDVKFNEESREFEVFDQGTTTKVESTETIKSAVEETVKDSGNTAGAIRKVVLVKQKGKDDVKVTLTEFRDEWNKGTYYNDFISATLTADVDLSNEEWLPIGNWQYPFHGLFDGNDKTIIAMHKSQATEQDVYATGSTIGYGQVYGFIGIAGDGDVTVQNINFTDVDISLVSKGKNVGTVIGYAPSVSKFKANDDGNDYSSKWTDALVDHAVTLKNITTKGSLTDNSHGGGLIGKMYSSGKLIITDCVNDVDVTVIGSGSASGIIGIVSNTKEVEIFNCVNKGDIKGPSYVAGIFNSSVTGSTNTIKNCLNEGNIECTLNGSNAYAAGIASIGNGDLIVQNLENKGNISFVKGNSVGGVLSGTGNDSLTIEAGYMKNSGNVTGGKQAGGILGSISNILTVNGSVTFTNEGNVTGTIVPSLGSNGVGAIMGSCKNCSMSNCQFINKGIISAPEGSYTGLFTGIMSNATISLTNCEFVNEGNIAKLNSNGAHASNRHHLYSIGINAVKNQIIGYVPDNGGNIILGENATEDASEEFALFADDLTIVMFAKEDPNWNDNKLTVVENGVKYKITREPREAYWYLYTIETVE